MNKKKTQVRKKVTERFNIAGCEDSGWAEDEGIFLKLENQENRVWPKPPEGARSFIVLPYKL